MSRIGNKPVQIPAGVEVAVNGNNVVVKGPKGQLELDVFEKLAINVEDNVLTVSRPDDERETRARHGLTRALIHNMVVGVSEGFEKKLELAGVGYRVQQKGKNLEFSLGFSHPVIVEANMYPCGNWKRLSSPGSTSTASSRIPWSTASSSAIRLIPSRLCRTNWAMKTACSTRPNLSPYGLSATRRWLHGCR